MNRYKYHDICRFRGVTTVYGIDVNYGMLEVRPCAILDMRLKQDSNEPVWKHRWTTSYCTFYMSHSLYNTTIHVNNTEQSNIRYNSLTYNKGKYVNQNQTKYQLQWLWYNYIHELFVRLTVCSANWDNWP